MKLRLVSASVCALFAHVALACSSGGGDIMMGSDNGGGSAGSKASGGESTGTAGDKPIGGNGSGGSSSGGEPTSGSANGGSGGESSAGSSNGGSANGGASTGGSSAGGAPSGGAGGGASTCQQDSDCVACAYDKAPANAQQCYCLTCTNAALSKTQCSANQAQFEKVCGNVVMQCPAIKCLPPFPVACQNHQCGWAMMSMP